MQTLFHPLHYRMLRCCFCLALSFGLAGCRSTDSSKTQDAEAKADAPAADVKTEGQVKDDGKDKDNQSVEDKAKDETIAAATPTPTAMDVRFLLSMDYTEAKAISANSVEMASGARIAADEIEVLKKDDQDRPTRVRAKGKVYLVTNTGKEAKILCQELYMNGTEAVSRGKPILQRGGSVVEGLTDKTVFYLVGHRLRVIGAHRLTNENAIASTMPDLGPWTQGPNPLLPALSEGTVPAAMRAEMQKAAEAEATFAKTKMEAEIAEAQAPKVGQAKSKAPGLKEAVAPEVPAAKAEPQQKGLKTKKTASATLKS